MKRPKHTILPIAALAGLALALAAPANAGNVLIDYDFQTMTPDTTTADTITYTGAHVDGTELMITAVSFSNYVVNAGGDIKWVGGNGLSVKGGGGGTQKNNLISYSKTSATNDPGAYETITISFDADVILNVGGDTGSWTINKAGATEAMRVVSSESGAPTDTGVDDAAAHSFVNITTLAAGETLTFTPYGVTGGVDDPDVSSIVGLGALSVYTESTAVADLTPPTPNPMEWASVPAAVIETEITMTASTATDPEGTAVQYLFTNTTLATDSGWQSSPIFIDIGLAHNTEYFYTVEARDVFNNTTAPSALVSATTLAEDLTAPPTPAFTIAPNALSFSEITMTAGAVVDPEGMDVEYYFTCTLGDGHDSGWQASPEYTDRWLKPGTSCEYTVTSRDLSLGMNESGPSAASPAAITPAVPSGQKLYSFEDFDNAGLALGVPAGNPDPGTNAFMDYDNTTTGTNNGVTVIENLVDLNLVGPNGQHMQLEKIDNRHISTEAGLLMLATDNIESIDVSFSVQYNNLNTRNLVLEYSALGDFSDTVEIFRRNPGDVDTPVQKIWYHITKTIYANEVTFTDAASFRWLTTIDKKTYLDDIIIVGTVGAADPEVADIRHLGTTVELDLAELDSAKTYKLYRDTTLPLSGSKVQIGGDISGTTATTVIDSSPLPVDGFYQLEQQP